MNANQARLHHPLFPHRRNLLRMVHRRHRQRHMNVLRSRHHMGIRDDVTRGIDDHTRADRMFARDQRRLPATTVLCRSIACHQNLHHRRRHSSRKLLDRRIQLLQNHRRLFRTRAHFFRLLVNRASLIGRVRLATRYGGLRFLLGKARNDKTEAPYIRCNPCKRHPNPNLRTAGGDQHSDTLLD